MTTPQETNFPVHGDTPERRRKKIEAVFNVSPMAGFLLGAINFEWTARRAILALGLDSTKDIRAAFEQAHGYDQYKDLWKHHVCKDGKNGHPRLPKLIRDCSEEDGKGTPLDWTDVRKAFKVRHTIAHGRACTAGADFLRRQMDVFLRAAEILVAFVRENGGDVYATIRRTNPRHR